jgi:predicted phage terminase large subunit-like protein
VDVADMGSDYLVSILAKIHKNGNIYVFDVICTQELIEKTEILVSNQIAFNTVDTVRIESNNGGRLFARNVINLTKGRCSTAITTIHNTQNKETRILLNSGYIKNKFFFLDKSEYDLGSDYDVFMKQILNYNKNGKNKHDDAVDSLTGLNEMIVNKNIEILK